MVNVLDHMRREMDMLRFKQGVVMLDMDWLMMELAMRCSGKDHGQHGRQDHFLELLSEFLFHM